MLTVSMLIFCFSSFLTSLGDMLNETGLLQMQQTGKTKLWPRNQHRDSQHRASSREVLIGSRKTLIETAAIFLVNIETVKVRIDPVPSKNSGMTLLQVILYKQVRHRRPFCLTLWHLQYYIDRENKHLGQNRPFF